MVGSGCGRAGQAVCPYDTIGLMSDSNRSFAVALLLRPSCLVRRRPPGTTSRSWSRPNIPGCSCGPRGCACCAASASAPRCAGSSFELLMAGNAPMPEPGFASALYYRSREMPMPGQRAVAWALGPRHRSAPTGTGLRLVPGLRDSGTQQRELAARIQKGMRTPRPMIALPAVRSRVLAAVALFDEVPQTPQQELERIVRQWWNGKIVPALKGGRSVIPRDDAYALLRVAPRGPRQLPTWICVKGAPLSSRISPSNT